MREIVLHGETDWGGWREATRSLILAGVEPAMVTWAVGDPSTDEQMARSEATFRVPRHAVQLASLAIQARDPERFGLLYALFWRLHAGERVLEDSGDPDLLLVRRMALAVRAEAHRMRTHLRFLPIREGSGMRYLGWYEPAHFVLEANAQLLAQRFPQHAFCIITPDRAAYWDGDTLLFGTGLRHVADDETFQAWWETHKGLLLDQATAEVSVPAAEVLDETPRPPDRPALGPVVLNRGAAPTILRAAWEARNCQRCPIHQYATQTVFGEGPANAAAMFVGEQPGDQEDVIGRPFVGPAGQLLDKAMEQAGIDRRTIYITNAVKHFKFVQRGKRRIHQTPEIPEIQACAFWLDVERVNLRPKLIVLMGGSAARALLGRAVTISRERGRPIQMADGQMVFVTVHPSFLLRLPDEAARVREYDAFVRDLRAVSALLEAT